MASSGWVIIRCRSTFKSVKVVTPTLQSGGDQRQKERKLVNTSRNPLRCVAEECLKDFAPFPVVCKVSAHRTAEVVHREIIHTGPSAYPLHGAAHGHVARDGEHPVFTYCGFRRRTEEGV